MPRVTFEGARYPLRDGETVLDALIRGGANVTFSCRKGTCHVCLLRASEGDPGAVASATLRPAMGERGYFLPCRSRPRGDLALERPRLGDIFVRARVHAKAPLSPQVVRILLEPETNLSWRAGQFVNVRRPDGLVRSYSLASIPEQDYFLELHVKRVDGGAMSAWLCDELQPDDEVEVQGPAGACYYEPEARAKNLVLLGTGTGLAPLWGIARDALRQGHEGLVFLYHSARTLEGLYLKDELRALAGAHPRFRYTLSVTGERAGACPGVAGGRVTKLAFDQHPDMRDWIVYLAGAPDMVYDARCRALLAGVARRDLRADPFENARPLVPNDAEKIARLAPEPELWRALGEGPRLVAILTDFYDLVYADPRLAPFFHGVTRQRAIDKQYEFLAGLFSGTKSFFGLRPFNAHHWMVISDELFDYREALIEDVMRRHGLDEALIRRWLAIHELFRRELVKGSPRGMIVHGQELPVDGVSDETLTVGAVCDGCEQEIPVGARGRLHARSGKLFCSRCAARSVGQTLPPAPA
jgi:ferredoxin-NADP reductase/ferredoxin/truncated hemoglobin YjbI